MVLSDEETKLFYQKFEELEKNMKKLEPIILKKQIRIALDKCSSLVKQIHNIVYDNNKS